jgi:pre-mRNA-splicing factor ATP-dependent RNA helicase DHX38/PRP16
MGAAMGIKAPVEEGAGAAGPEHIDYKSDSQFGQHMTRPTEAVSDFARNKTMKQQREFLPIFHVRQHLLQIVRENQSACLCLSIFLCLPLHVLLHSHSHTPQSW